MRSVLVAGVQQSRSRAERPNGVVFDVQHYALYDGPGIRTALYLKGCPLRCFWCHNPESQVRRPQTMRRADSCGARSDATDTVGWRSSVDDAVEELMVDRAFFDASGGGVTITGGEPTSQAEFLLAVLRRVRERGVHTAIETCGSFLPDLIDPLVACVDLFLFDIKHLDPDAHRRGTGSANERIVENFVALLSRVGPDRITPRVPVVPGYNADERSMRDIMRFLAGVGYCGDVHLMPYHGWARDKYRRLGRSGDAPSVTEPSAELLARVEALARDHGLTPVLHG